MPEATAARRIEIWLPILIVVVDQIAKAMIRAKLTLYSSVTIVPGFMDFTYVPNTGVAYGILNGVNFPFKAALLAMISTAGMVGVAIYAAGTARHQLVARVGLALIIGGAAGNLIDRVVTGSVVDFVDVYWRTHHFWVFNIADSAISVGVAVMILDMLGLGAHVSKTA